MEATEVVASSEVGLWPEPCQDSSMNPAAKSAALVCAFGLTVAVLTGCAPTAVPTSAPTDASAAPAAEDAAAADTAAEQAIDEAESAARRAADDAQAALRQTEYDETTDALADRMPDGYTFPEQAPTANLGRAGISNGAGGELIAYAVWRCSVAQAARDAQVNDGDYVTGRALLAQIEAVGDDVLPGNGEWLQRVLPDADSIRFNGALEGETGMCYFWLRPHGRWNV